MLFKALLLCSCLCAVLSYPTADHFAYEEFTAYGEPSPSELEPSRMKRQFNLQGGGSPRQGFDINANARFPIWQSQNERNSLHGMASYSQHLGGPYGNSPPNYGGGLQFTHRF